MQYTTIEKLNARPSRLGFGCMRFPVTPEGKIDEPRALAMIDSAYRAGVNYFDTAYFYHQRASEEFVGRALARYPRDSFYLATKLPLAMIETLDQAKEIFEEQLGLLQTDHFDFYLMHALNGARWDDALRLGIVEYLVQQKRQGRIHHLGFSFHDNYDAFERILSARDWDFCQIQFNYMDIDEQAGMKGYLLAERLGVPVVVMEPVKGGSLATLSDEITALFKAERPDLSVASWAMRWVGSLPNCRVILSGMSDEGQVEDNLGTFEHFEPLSEREQQIIAKAREAIRARVFTGCTACRYCMPCPFGVDIPRNFKMMNEYAMYSNAQRLAQEWSDISAQERASACTRCGKCERACPQRLPIRQKLKEIAEKMA